MKSFLLALQFLTVIPVSSSHFDEKKASESMVYFPLIGALLGLVLSGINSLLYTLGVPQLSINIIIVISLIFLTGGIHLDGLSDTFDAFSSERKKEDMLKIMRDPHIGAIGVLAMISVILLKISLLQSISIPLKTISLILMCTLSRWSLILLIFLFPYARREGKARIFTQGINPKIFVLTAIVTLTCTGIIWNIRGLLALATATVFVYLIGKFTNRKIGGITGDTLGAMNELAEVIVLLSICLIERTGYG